MWDGPGWGGEGGVATPARVLSGPLWRISILGVQLGPALPHSPQRSGPIQHTQYDELKLTHFEGTLGRKGREGGDRGDRGREEGPKL